MAAEGTNFLVLFFSNFERIIQCEPKAVIVYKLKIQFYAYI